VVDDAFVTRLALCLPRDAGGVRLVRLVLETALAALGVTANAGTTSRSRSVKRAATLSVTPAAVTCTRSALNSTTGSA